MMSENLKLDLVASNPIQSNNLRMAKNTENTAGPLIEARLREMGKTQQWLADYCGVTGVSVHNWIKNGEISRKNLAAVSIALGISVQKLLGTEQKELPVVAPQAPPKLILQYIMPDEQELLEGYRLCTDEGKAIARDFVIKVAPKKDDGEPMLGRRYAA